MLKAEFTPLSQCHVLDEAMVLAAHLHDPPGRDIPAFKYGCEFAHNFLELWENYCDSNCLGYE